MEREFPCSHSLDPCWFEDFNVHETAHPFHNCQRRARGLPGSSAGEWPLDIAHDKRETFAYSCEAFSGVVELGSTPKARRALVRELADGPTRGGGTIHGGNIARGERS